MVIPPDLCKPSFLRGIPNRLSTNTNLKCIPCEGHTQRHTKCRRTIINCKVSWIFSINHTKCTLETNCQNRQKKSPVRYPLASIIPRQAGTTHSYPTISLFSELTLPILVTPGASLESLEEELLSSGDLISRSSREGTRTL